MATPREVVVLGLPPLLLHNGVGSSGNAPGDQLLVLLHNGMGSGGDAHGDQLLVLLNNGVVSSGGAHGDGLLVVVPPLNLHGLSGLSSHSQGLIPYSLGLICTLPFKACSPTVLVLVPL